MPYKDLKVRQAYHREYAKTEKGHVQRLAVSRRKQDFVIRLKNKPCADCYGWFDYWQMDFDHLDSNTKIDTIGNLRSCSRKRILEEISKCELVCANCHRTRTHKRKQYNKIRGDE
jgi:hypothetical protein